MASLGGVCPPWAFPGCGTRNAPGWVDGPDAPMAKAAHGENGAAMRMRLEPQSPGHVTAVLRRFLAPYSPEKLTNLLAVVVENKVRLRSL